jgi:hypothetical protein
VETGGEAGERCGEVGKLDVIIVVVNVKDM